MTRKHGDRIRPLHKHSDLYSKNNSLLIDETESSLDKKSMLPVHIKQSSNYENEPEKGIRRL